LLVQEFNDDDGDDDDDDGDDGDLDLSPSRATATSGWLKIITYAKMVTSVSERMDIHTDRQTEHAAIPRSTQWS